MKIDFKNDMRNILLSLGGIAILGASVGVFGLQQLGVFNGNSPIYKSFSSMESAVKSGKAKILQSTKNHDLKQVERVKIETNSRDIHFVYEDRSDIEVSLEGHFLSNDQGDMPYLEMSEKHGEVRFEVRNKTTNKLTLINFQGYMETLNLIVKMPKSYEGALELNAISGNIYFPGGKFKELALNTSSGYIYHQGVELTDVTLDHSALKSDRTAIEASLLKIETVSGDISLFECSGDNFDLVTSSGVTSMEDARFKAIKIQSVSGDITGKGVDTETAEIETSSSAIVLEQLSGEASIITTSGDIRVTDSPDVKRYTLNSSSGNVDLDIIPGTSQIRTVSGNISGKLMTLNGNIDIESSSGNVELSGTANLDATLEIETSSGNMNIAPEIKISGNVNNREDNQIKGDMGKGGSILKIMTVSGDINLTD